MNWMITEVSFCTMPLFIMMLLLHKHAFLYLFIALFFPLDRLQ